MMAVDILPTALPLEASQHFSRAFLPYLRAAMRTYTGPSASSSGEDTAIAEALERATVASGGELRPSFACLRRPLGVWKDNVADARTAAPITPTTTEDTKSGPAGLGAATKKRVLVLGSGMVAPPAVAELCSRPDVQVVVGQSLYSGI